MFPLEQVPEITRGRGVRLQRFKDGGLSDIKTFSAAEGLSWTIAPAVLFAFVRGACRLAREPRGGWPAPPKAFRAPINLAEPRPAALASRAVMLSLRPKMASTRRRRALLVGRMSTHVFTSCVYCSRPPRPRWPCRLLESRIREGRMSRARSIRSADFPPGTGADVFVRFYGKMSRMFGKTSSPKTRPARSATSRPNTSRSPSPTVTPFSLRRAVHSWPRRRACSRNSPSIRSTISNT